MLLIVRAGNLQHVAELQLHIESIKTVKQKAHRLYKVLRSYGWEEEEGVRSYVPAPPAPPSGPRTGAEPSSLPGTDAYQSDLDRLRFDLESEFPEVIISYATASTGGYGEWWMWKVAAALRYAGIASYNGKQNTTGGDWVEHFFGRLVDGRSKVFIAMISAEYFRSQACRDEIYEAARLKKCIIPVVVGTPPRGLRHGVDEPYFGGTPQEASTDENIRLGNVVSMHIGNYLPPPDRDDGLFQNNFEQHCTTLVDIVRQKLG